MSVRLSALLTELYLLNDHTYFFPVPTLNDKRIIIIKIEWNLMYSLWMILNDDIAEKLRKSFIYVILVDYLFSLNNFTIWFKFREVEQTPCDRLSFLLSKVKCVSFLSLSHDNSSLHVMSVWDQCVVLSVWCVKEDRRVSKWVVCTLLGKISFNSFILLH